MTNGTTAEDAARTDADASTRTATRAQRPLDPRLLRYARAARGFFALSVLVTIGQTSVTIAFAWLLTRTLVGAIDGDPVASLVPFLAGAFLVALVRAALIVVSERVGAEAAARSSLQLRAALVAAVQRLGPGWLARRNAARLALIAGHGLESLDAYFGRYLPQLVATVITTPVLIAAILVADPLSGLIVIVTIPLIPIFLALIGLATRAVQRRQLATLTRLASRFADTVSGLGTLKIFGRQHRAADSIERITRDYKRETMTVLRVSFLSGFALEFLASISVAIVAVTIGLRLLGGELTLFVGLFVLLLAPEAYLPVRQVGVQFHAAAEGVAATDELFAVLDEAEGLARDASRTASSAVQSPDGLRPSPARPDACTADDAPPPAPAVSPAPLLEARELRVVRGERAVGPICLAVDAGEVVLIEGPSGAGKSSILAALLGFAACDGTILVGGEPATDARRLLAWSGQRPGLVAGTVLENVALGDPVPDRARVESCLAAAQVGDLRPDRVLGVGGDGLSGGQAQRVGVARALYRLRSPGAEAAVLALDEPSSALDAQTEAALWATLRAEADAGAGVLLVSHRTSARGIADRIVALDAGVAS